MTELEEAIEESKRITAEKYRAKILGEWIEKWAPILAIACILTLAGSCCWLGFYLGGKY